MSGLQRGTTDYRVILHSFQTKRYSTSNYNPEEIRKSNPDWERKYDAVAFAESLRHLVATVYLAPPPPILPQTAAPAPPADTPPLDTMNHQGWTSHPQDANEVPAGATLLMEGIPLITPKQVVSWCDTTKNQNTRLTCYVLMPPGNPNEHFDVRVEAGGLYATITYKWPEEMLSDQILKKMGYRDGHNKLIAFNEHVRQLRGGRSDQPVFSKFRIALPFAVEEQLTNVLVPRPIYTATIATRHTPPCRSKVLVLEMMAIRGNYQAMRVEAEYDSPTRTTTNAAPVPAAAQHFAAPPHVPRQPVFQQQQQQQQPPPVQQQQPPPVQQQQQQQQPPPPVQQQQPPPVQQQQQQQQPPPPVQQQQPPPVQQQQPPVQQQQQPRVQLPSASLAGQVAAAALERQRRQAQQQAGAPTEGATTMQQQRRVQFMRQPSASELRAARQGDPRRNQRRDEYVQARRNEVIVQFGDDDDDDDTQATADMSAVSGFSFLGNDNGMDDNRKTAQ